MKFKTKDLIKIAIPIILEYMLSIMVNLFDTIMVSSSGEAAVSAVSLVGSISAFLTVFFISLCVGGAVVISQLVGKKNFETARESAKQLVYLSFIVSSVVCAIIVLFDGPILQLIFGKVEPEIMNNAKKYFFIIGLCYPVIGIQAACASILRAQGKTKLTLWISVGGNLVNICGNAILIYGFGLGVVGAAVSSLISYIVSTIIAFRFVLRKGEETVYIDKFFKYKPNMWHIRKICHIGIPSSLEDSFFNLGRLLVASLVSGFGTASIAANAVAQTLTGFHFQAGSAIGAACMTVVGMCVGARDHAEAKKSVKKFMLFVVITFAILSVFFIATSGFFAKVFNLSDEATKICNKIILINGIATVIIWTFAFTLSAAFRAASDVRFTMVVSIFSMFTFRVGGSYLLANAFGLGVYSVWIAMICDWVFRASVFVPRFIKGKWLTKYTD